MQDIYENNDVQDLYDEIEHLIDVPFEKFSKSVEYAAQHQEFHDTSIASSPTSANNEYSFDRPILIESDSDEIEEELPTPQHTMLTCYRCNRLIPCDPSYNNTLSVSTSYVCEDCSKKKRSRSRSFTLEGNNVLTMVADKLKQSFSSNNSSNVLLSPNSASKPVDRRKSMPSMNQIFSSQQSLEPVSPSISRPSSRASSFIEDVKQFLAPLSRKSSRNSLFQDFQRSTSPVDPLSIPKEPKRKSSHSSLLSAINICKPKNRTSQSYESEKTNHSFTPQSDDCWAQEDSEVMGINQRQQIEMSPEQLQIQNNVYIPLRRKQIKQIESREERMNIYNNAFLECMETQTYLIPWIVKQTQKGPPDAWFGYTPPPREPKKFLGLFKIKQKASKNLRAQQQQLGDELLNRSTPLLYHRFSNSNLSVSPNDQSFIFPDDQAAEFSTSPGAITPQDLSFENEQNDYYDQQEEEEQQEDFHEAYHEKPHTMPGDNSRPSSTQPVSILKKTHSSTQLKPNYNDEEEHFPPDEYDQYDEEGGNDYYYAQPPRRQRSYRQENTNYAPGHIHTKRSMEFSRNRRGGDDYFYAPPRTMTPTRSRTPTRSMTPTRNNMTPRPYYDDPYYEPPRRSRRNSYREPEEEYHGGRRRRTPSYTYDHYEYDEWEANLDELCDTFPRLDRAYVNDFLNSAQGDFMLAKSMIIDMIMDR